MIHRRDGEGMTEFTIRRIRAEVIERELKDLADCFEGAGPDAPWRGQEIADHLRERIKNHPALSNGERGHG
jgi:hypothetical protein